MSDPLPTAPAAGDATPRATAIDWLSPRTDALRAEHFNAEFPNCFEPFESLCEELEAETARLSALADGYKKTLLFVRDECDWEHQPHSKDGGDDRIGPAITAAVGEGKLPVVRHEELAQLKADLAALRAALEIIYRDERPEMPDFYDVWQWSKKVAGDALKHITPPANPSENDR